MNTWAHREDKSVRMLKVKSLNLNFILGDGEYDPTFTGCYLSLKLWYGWVNLGAVYLLNLSGIVLGTSSYILMTKFTVMLILYTTCKLCKIDFRN